MTLSTDSLLFLDDLTNNNNRDWFLENKKRYDLFKKEYQNLTSAFLEALKPFDDSLKNLEVKNCTFRINRDIRFSKNKSPYKTNLGMYFSGGGKNNLKSGYYIHIERKGCFFGGGLYAPETPELKKVRTEIAYFYEDLQTILNNKKFKSVYGKLNENENIKLKNPPKGFDKEHPAVELLKLKSFTATHNFDILETQKTDFITSVVSGLIALKPFNDFLNRALEIT